MESEESPPPTFVDDYYKKIAQTQRIYQTLTSSESVLLFRTSRLDMRSITLNNISGLVPSRLAYFLHNLKQVPVTLYLSVAGEWEFLTEGKLGGNSGLTLKGEAYGRALHDYMAKEMDGDPFVIMSSGQKRSRQTCRFLMQNRRLGDSSPTSPLMSPTDSHLHFFAEDDRQAVTQLRCRAHFFPTLDELSFGFCEGMTEEQAAAAYPDFTERCRHNPYTATWPNGESVKQVFESRLEPHIRNYRE